MESSVERKIKVWRLRDKVRMVLMPKDFAGSNRKILRRILEEGHELGIHGWKHRAWTRALDKIKIREHVSRARGRYRRLFNSESISFAAPGFNTNKKVLEVLEENKILFISDFEGNSSKFYGKIKNVPMTILGKNKTPIIEHLVSIGKKDEEIIKMIKEMIKEKDLCSLYIHGLFEARFKLRILEEIFRYVKRNKINNKRIIDY